jgi:hypothetical protein
VQKHPESMAKVESGKSKTKHPGFAGMCKIHKVDIPITPVVNFKNAPSYN